MRRVQIVIVTPAPKESFAIRDALDVVRIDVMPRKNVHFRISKIVSDHADDIYISKKTRRQRKVRRRTTKNLVALAKRRFHRIKRNRTYNC